MKMKKCPFCAEEIQDEAIVCRYCGRDLPQKPITSQPIQKTSQPTKKSSDIVPISIILGCIIICGLCVYIFVGSSGNKSNKTSSTVSENDALRFLQKWKSPANNGLTCKEIVDAIVDTYKFDLGIYDAEARWSVSRTDETNFVVHARIKGETGWADFSWSVNPKNRTIQTISGGICPP